MPRTCSICTHADRTGIEQAVVSGTSYRNISVRFEVSLAALTRHRAHMGRAIQRAEQAQAVDTLGRVLAELQTIHAQAKAVLAEAQAEKRHGSFWMGCRELRKNLMVLAGLIPKAGPAVPITRVRWIDPDTPDEPRELEMPSWLERRTAAVIRQQIREARNAAAANENEKENV